MDTYRKKTILLLFFLLALFTAAFFASIYALNKGVALVRFGGSGPLSNWIIASLSVLSIIRIIWEINEVEHPDEHRARLKAMLRQGG